MPLFGASISRFNALRIAAYGDVARADHTRMPGDLAPTFATHRWLVMALAVVFMVAGLTGHDPWKADEAYVFGVIQHMIETSDWVVPTLAGEPFMEKPPLYYWVATLLSRALSGWLPMHDAARLASGAFMLLTCWTLASAARLWWGPGVGRYAVLVLLGCLGTLVQSHMMMPDVALLAGFAVSALGFATVLSRSVAGGLLLGTGAGIGFMSKGVIGPGVMVLTALLLPLLFRQWRTRSYRHGLVIAAVTILPWCVIWPLALYLRSPELFIDWIWLNNIGRFFGFSVHLLGAEHLPWFWTRTLPWFTFPGLPLALWLLWRQRRSALSQPAVQFASVAITVLLLVLAVSSSGRCVYAWPLMVPLAILGAPGAMHLPRAIDRTWAAAGMALFGLLSLAIWVGWGVMMGTGAPPAWPYLLRHLPGDFTLPFDAIAATAAALVTIGAPVLLYRTRTLPAWGLMAWVTGLALTWSLLMTLWLPWLDHAKSYRDVFVAMPLPRSADCVTSIGLGEGERAMFYYITGRNTLRREIKPDAACSVLVVQKEQKLGTPDVDLQKWQEVWQGSRPGITNERFWLYRRAE